MPLNHANFNVKPLTEAINRLPVSPSLIRQLGIFTPKYLTTTYVDVEQKNGILTLVKNEARGASGQGVKSERKPSKTFKMTHLPKDDVVLADEVQNIRAFGSENTAETVAEKVNEKLEAMKSDIELTREHLMLGALLGKIVDADGSAIYDIYQEFGLTRAEFTLDLTAKNVEVGAFFDTVKNALDKKRSGETGTGWIVLASPEFMQSIVYHPTVKEIYLRHQEAAVYRDGKTNAKFSHMDIDFYQYNHEFDSGVKIPAGEAIILPKDTRKTFHEYFAPADMSIAVNTTAKPYYASREPLDHSKGWSLHAQSNPLPLVLRPELVATLKINQG